MNEEIKPEPNNIPTSADLISPEFNAVWNAIKKWDIEREEGLGYAGATGTDVMIILNALRVIDKIPEENNEQSIPVNDWEIEFKKEFIKILNNFSHNEGYERGETHLFYKNNDKIGRA